MILISDDNFKLMQSNYIPVFNRYVQKMESSNITTADMNQQFSYLASIIKISFIGELDFNKFLDYTNKIIGNSICKYFIIPHSKKEIRNYCRNL